MAAPISAQVVELVRRAQQGSEEAAARVCEECSGPLLAFARRLLHQPLARIRDPEDFVIDALTKMCKGRFPPRALSCPEELWKYVCAIIKHLVYKELAKHRDQLTKEVPLESAPGNPVSRDTGPEEAAQLHELVAAPEPFLRRLPPARRGIAELLLVGSTPAEVGLELKQWEVYAVKRWLERQIGKP
jgi:DNA-directed RNA polymerase specialized sigma24 family protein